MNDISALELIELEEYLAGLAKPLPLEYVDGVLYAIAMTPGVIPPSKWLPLIFDPATHEFQSEQQAQRYLGLLMRLHNINASWVAPAAVHSDATPEDEEFSPLIDTADTYEEQGADVAGVAWSFGFTVATNLWHTELDFDTEQYPQLAPLLNIPMRLAIEDHHALLDDNGQPLLALKGEERQKYLDLLKPAILMLARELASIGRTPVRSIKVGRNEPCPCGSGKKYKKCCGQSVH